MSLSYFLKCGLLSSGLVAATWAAQAQALLPDSTRPLAPPRTLLKAGFRLTHLSYSFGSQTWRFVVPFSLGAEYRLVPRFSVYGQAEADLQASRSLTARRRRQVGSLVPAATLGLGLRYYYNQPKQGETKQRNQLYGNYLSLQGSVERDEITASYVTSSRRQTPTCLTPSVYAFWGTQHQLRRHLLYDLNAGLGVLAPAYYNFEHIGATRYDMAAQVNIRVYWSKGF